MVPVLRAARLTEWAAPSEQQAPLIVEAEIEQQLARVGRDLSERQDGSTDVVGKRLGGDLIGVRRDDGAPQARPEIARVCIRAHYDAIGGDAPATLRRDNPAISLAFEPCRPRVAMYGCSGDNRRAGERPRIGEGLNGAAAPINPTAKILRGSQMPVGLRFVERFDRGAASRPLLSATS